jgi:hypothetical protein
MIRKLKRTAHWPALALGLSTGLALIAQPGGLSSAPAAQDPPQIISTSPARGVSAVSPALKEITVTFDQDMGDGMSWTGGGPEFPPTPQGQQAYWRDQRTCVLPVKLQGGHRYRVGINSQSYLNFRSAAGVPALPSAIWFTTQGTGARPKGQTEAASAETGANAGINPALAATAFDQLWAAFDRDYAMFKLRPQVDWAGLREQYRPKALQAASIYDFAVVCADMLRPLRDMHIWLKVSGEDIPVFHRFAEANANPSARRSILGDLKDACPEVQWAVTADKIGFLAVSAWNWNDKGIPARCDEALERMRDTRGLIVDVRLNGGGSENLAGEVAGRFLPKPFVYAYDQRRKGPGHTDLTAKSPRTVQPRGPWRYDHPVLLLIGQKCMSSNESFVAMMSGVPGIVIMGDHTRGSSGNPRDVHLPMDITVSVPQWIDYLPDGTVLDERGFQPQVPFQPAPGAFQGKRDDLLTAALDRLRQRADQNTHLSLPDRAARSSLRTAAVPGAPVVYALKTSVQ